jgi:undecaprenyl-diphosphatase
MKVIFSGAAGMESWLQTIIGWLPSGWLYYCLLGLISFFESLAGVGILVPGSVLIVFAGFLAAHGRGNYPLLVFVSALGAIFGDLLSYWLGARLGSYLRQQRIFRRRKPLLRKAEVFFMAHGGKSVFFGRFVGFLRPFIPFVAGSTHMRPLPFVLYALVSGLLWGVAYPGLGYFFGASWQLVQVWTGRLSIFIGLLIVMFILNALFWRWLAPRLGRLLGKLWILCRKAWERVLATPALTHFRSRHPGFWTFLADRFTLRKGSGLYLTAGFTVSALFAALFFWLVKAVHLQRTLILLDRRVYDLMGELRHPAADTFFLLITYLGSVPVVAMLGALLLLWLILHNRDFSAAIVIAGVTGGELLVFFLKYVFGLPRPLSFLPALELLSPGFPSAHAFLAVVFYGLATYMLLGTIRNWQSRFYLVLAGSFLALVIGFSRIYLGVHWLSDVLGGLALAAVWLTFLVTASEMRRRYAGEFPWRLGWQPVRISRSLRSVLLSLASLGTMAGIAIYLIDRLREM